VRRPAFVSIVIHKYMLIMKDREKGQKVSKISKIRAQKGVRFCGWKLDSSLRKWAGLKETWRRNVRNNLVS
jgi:hypothetical protein